MIRHPMDEIREAVANGEFSASAIARAAGRAPQTLGKAIRGIIDTPESTSKEYSEALQRLRAKRDAAKPAVGGAAA